MTVNNEEGQGGYWLSDDPDCQLLIGEIRALITKTFSFA
jgi:hypothetical protein